MCTVRCSFQFLQIIPCVSHAYYGIQVYSDKKIKKAMLWSVTIVIESICGKALHISVCLKQKARFKSSFCHKARYVTCVGSLRSTYIIRLLFRYNDAVSTMYVVLSSLEEGLDKNLPEFISVGI